jgi:hypothetical protein
MQLANEEHIEYCIIYDTIKMKNKSYIVQNLQMLRGQKKQIIRTAYPSQNVAQV